MRNSKQQIEELKNELKSALVLIKTLQSENVILQQKVQFLLRRLFGKKSEKIDSRQLELMLEMLGDSKEQEDDAEESECDPELSQQRQGKRGERKPRLPEDLPTEEVIIDPDEVKANPEAYQCIGQEVLEELDVIPQTYFRRLIIRRKYKSKENRSMPPIIAPAPNRLMEGGYAGVGLLVDIVLKKYVDHLPLYRQERILHDRYGIDLTRKRMADWVRVVADWLKPIYNYQREALKKTGYLQIDETPVKYAMAEGGGSGQGYLWVYHHPGGDVLYEWHKSRGAKCLKGMLDGFTGKVQSDGYNAYKSYAKNNGGVKLSGCWAHARRKFYEAREESPDIAGWFLHQIGLLYHLESSLRESGVSDKMRGVARAVESTMVLNRIDRALKRKLSCHLPESQMGKAIGYALGHWNELCVYAEDGELEIDNNLVENAVRPTALGKKNWLFIGHPEAGDRSAIIYTLLESCKRHGINRRDYLMDVLRRLPDMKITEISALAPANWITVKQKQTA